MKRSRSKRTVLVVDDYDDNREMYAEYLRFAGFRTITASNGEEALTLASAEHPDVIALDLSMPVLDGWEAARRLKADPETKDICIIAVTGHAEAPHIKRAKEAGCDYFIAKPCLTQQLVAEVEARIDKTKPR